jgi:Zn-dependent protease with chaperone function
MVARQVQYSVNMMAANLIANGLSRWYNPVWWFINGYYRIFLRITLGASRLQEILADRIATLAYGIQNFSTGLTAIIRADLEFDFKINSEVAAAQNARRGLNNLYALPELEDATPLEQKLSEMMARPSSPYDSHPAPRERLALIKRIQTAGFFDEDPRPACALLPDASQLQAEVTAEIEERLRAQNIL